MLLVAIVVCVPAEVTLLSSVPLKAAELNVLNAAHSMAWMMEYREKRFIQSQLWLYSDGSRWMEYEYGAIFSMILKGRYSEAVSDSMEIIIPPR